MATTPNNAIPTIGEVKELNPKWLLLGTHNGLTLNEAINDETLISDTDSWRWLNTNINKIGTGSYKMDLLMQLSISIPNYEYVTNLSHYGVFDRIGLTPELYTFNAIDTATVIGGMSEQIHSECSVMIEQPFADTPQIYVKMKLECTTAASADLGISFFFWGGVNLTKIPADKITV